MNNLLISCRGLCKSYGHKRALQGVDLQVDRGRIVGLLGPNGSGKTTLIKILCGLLQPTAGDLSIDGQPVGVHSKSIISYLPDRMYFADWMKATDLFDLFSDFYADFDRQKAMAMCASLGVDPTLLYFGLLSGATLGGNCTPIGASANIAGIGILRKAGYEVKTSDFTRIGVPFTLAAVIPSYIYFWLLYA